MKRLLLAIILILSLIFTSCSSSQENPGVTDNESENGSDGNTDSGGGNSGSDGLTDSTHTHTDTDNNTKCDVCGIYVIVELDFYAINDLHGKFADSDSQPGVNELTTYLKKAYEDNQNALLLSSGDMWQGSSESNLTKGLIVTDWMNELSFTSMTLGNHEFDWGEEPIKSNLAIAKFPFLAINIYDKSTNKRVEYAEASVMVEKSGVKVGIIGAIGDCYSSIAPDKVENLYFKTGSELTELVMNESKRLRENGADLIVYSIHDGHGSSGGSVISDSKLSSYYSPSLSKGKYVDIVFEGHSHKNYVLLDSYGVYHLQNGGENKGISHAEIKFNIANDKYAVTESEVVSSSDYSKHTPDTLIDTLLKKYESLIAIGNEVLGTNAKKRYSTELEKLVSKLYLETGLKKWGSQYEVFLGGGFIKARSPYDLEAGEVTYSELQAIFPFDNELTLCSIKGKYLKSKFLNTTNEDYYVSLSDYGEAKKGTVDDNATYYIIVDSYTSSYAPNKLTVIDTYDKITFARDLLAEHVKGGGLNN